MPITWSGCFRVSNSKFVDVQKTQKNFAEFVEKFLDPTTFRLADRKEALPLFMPAEYARVGARRCAANVLRVHMLVLDFDKGTPAQISQVLENAARFGHVAYTSFNHDPKGQWKFRTVTKLSRPVDQTEWSKFFPRAVDALGATGLNDIKCADPCHMFYVPGGKDRTLYRCIGEDGPALDVDAVLQRPLPKGAVEEKQKIYPEVLEEKDRAQIDEGLKLLWDAKLSNVADEISEAPFPGSIYHLKSHAVFGLARGIPHIISEERVRRMVRAALDQRYNGYNDDAVEAYKIKSYKQVEEAIEKGKSKPWWPPKVEEADAHALTDMGLAERLLERDHENIAYEPTWDKWLVWNGKYWNADAGDTLVQERMKEAVREIEFGELNVRLMECWRLKELHEGVKDDKNASEELKARAEYEYEEAKKAIAQLAKFAEKSQQAPRVAAGVALATSDPRVLCSYTEMNKDPWLLNALNGTVDLRTGILRPHRREDMITRIVPHEILDTPTPYFDRFLEEITCGDKELIQFLWRLWGYVAIGITSEQIIIIFHGDGANGKSTYLRLKLEAFGHGPSGYGHAAQSSNLLTHKGADQHSTWRMGMFGKRAVIIQEVEEGRTLAESQLKELTGGDLITGRKMRQDEWSYVPEFTPLLGCNSLPHVRGIDEGIWRRFVIIPCKASFKGREDKGMFEKLKAEIPGIWYRAVKEAVLWRQAGGLTVPQAVVEATSAYRIEQDPLRDFFEKWCVMGEPGSFVSRANVWNAYAEYCEDTRQQMFHERKRFYAAVEKTGKALGDAFDEHKRNGVRGFIRLRLKEPKERQEASPRAQLQKMLEDQQKPKN